MADLFRLDADNEMAKLPEYVPDFETLWSGVRRLAVETLLAGMVGLGMPAFGCA